MKRSLIYKAQVYGDGKKKVKHGNLFGQLYPRLKTAAMHLFIVGAKKGAKDDTNVLRPTLTALPYVIVEETDRKILCLVHLKGFLKKNI